MENAMPLDGILEVKDNLITVEDHLDFDVSFETTKFHKKKYVINENTGEYIGVVILNSSKELVKLYKTIELPKN